MKLLYIRHNGGELKDRAVCRAHLKLKRGVEGSVVQGSSDLCWGGMKRTVQPDTLPPAAASHRVFKGLEGKSAAIKGQTPKGHAGGAGLVSSPLLPPLRGGQIGPILQVKGVF